MMAGKKERSGGARAGAGRPSDEGIVHDRFGVRPPLPVLLDEIERRYGADAAADLKAIYDAAQRRSERAHRLLGFEREVRRGPSVMRTELKIERRRRVLENPEAYIDGVIDLLDE